MLGAMAILVSGCIVPIPTPNGPITGGIEVRQADLAFLQPGNTTKEEVLQHLGQPTIIWRDENTLIYRWVQTMGLLFWGVTSGYSGAFGAMEIKADYAYLVRFDATDHFISSETVRTPRSKAFGKFLLDWRDAQRAKEATGNPVP